MHFLYVLDTYIVLLSPIGLMVTAGQQGQYPDKCPTYHAQMHTDTEYRKSTVSLRPLLAAQKPQEERKRY